METQSEMPPVAQRPKRWSRRRVVIVLVIVALCVSIGIAASLVLGPRRRADAVISAIHASFPDFCPDGQILAEAIATNNLPGQTPRSAGHWWAIRCDAWMKSPGGYSGYAAVVDVDKCDVTFAAGATLGKYSYELETLSQHNGTMPVCPQP